MADYKKMYLKAASALTNAEELLRQATFIIQLAQHECEDIYIEGEVSKSVDGKEPSCVD